MYQNGGYMEVVLSEVVYARPLPLLLASSRMEVVAFVEQHRADFLVEG